MPGLRPTSEPGYVNQAIYLRLRLYATPQKCYPYLCSVRGKGFLRMFKVGDSVIRAKSGLLGAERGEPSLGWMVG